MLRISRTCVIIMRVELIQSALYRRLGGLKNVAVVKENALKQIPGLHDALLLQRRLKQENKFRGTVFEPVRLLISPKDPKFARAIEGCVDSYTLNVCSCSFKDAFSQVILRN